MSLWLKLRGGGVLGSGQSLTVPPRTGLLLPALGSKVSEESLACTSGLITVLSVS